MGRSIAGPGAPPRGSGQRRGRWFSAQEPLNTIPWDLRLENTSLTGTADGAAVTTWTGSSGSASQTDPAAKPTYRTTGIVAPKVGAGVVDFDGTDDALNNTLPATTPFTAFIVVNLRPKTPNAILVSTQSNGGSTLFLTGGAAGLGLSVWGVADVGAWTRPGGAFPTGVWTVIGARYSPTGGTWELSVNGASVASGSTPLTPTGGTRRYGCGPAAGSTVLNAEVAAIFERAALLSSADFAKIGARLAAKYVP